MWLGSSSGRKRTSPGDSRSLVTGSISASLNATGARVSGA